MIKPIIVLAASAAFLAACGSNEETGPVEGPAVAASDAPRNEAVDTTETPQDAALTPGANSFTETQAREAIEKQGYTGVGTLSQNENGIWSAPATREGTETTVSVDYKGVVTAQ
ncbi:hypothetical protein BZG35_14455 [Brevundimonas sp. LM2]|uniref:hypothetical protein n=1 Tax=Brevundimonas sp. LM2 TaxID=1938605 RepID=UPI000984010B|nr:hypothetical protein [Brevundimonas sp. LM2]AQR62715.1 hypothetical protein BZG35_14455 [Brevundimonas sp. LM2]